MEEQQFIYVKVVGKKDLTFRSPASKESVVKEIRSKYSLEGGGLRLNGVTLLGDCDLVAETYYNFEDFQTKGE